MKQRRLRFGRGVRVALGNRPQAAEMVRPPAYAKAGDELPRGKR